MKIKIKYIPSTHKIEVWVGRKIKTLQVGRKLIILDGKNPVRYVDLATNKVHQYK